VTRCAVLWRGVVCVGASVMVIHCRAPSDTPRSAVVEEPPTARVDRVVARDTRRHYVLLSDGGDTIATEVVDDGDGWVESVLQWTRRGEQHRMFVTVDARGIPRTWDVQRAWPASRGRLEDRWRVLFMADSVYVVQGALIGVPVSITAAEAPVQAVPWHDASVALLELLTRRGATTVTALSMPPADRRRRVRVQYVRADSLRLVHPEGDWWLALDSTGRVLRATSPSRRLQVRRVAAPSTDDTVSRLLAPGVSAEPLALRAPDGVRLAGEFVRPVGAPVRAVVIFVSGSGPQDRDLAVPGFARYRPFAELAEALATQGVGSVRLDDRGVGSSGGAAFQATRGDEVRDVQAAVRWLRLRDGVHGVPLVLVGHSDGAHVALDVAAADTTIRGVVLLAAPARSGRELARTQRRAWRTPRAETSTITGQALRDAALLDAEAATERLASLDPWLRDWLRHDPRVDVRALTADVLLVHGEQDQQVPVAQADELAALLRARGVGAVQVQRIPGVNHLLLPDSVGDPQRYGRLSGRTLPASVRDPIVQWVTTRHRGGR